MLLLCVYVCILYLNNGEEESQFFHKLSSRKKEICLWMVLHIPTDTEVKKEDMLLLLSTEKVFSFGK